MGAGVTAFRITRARRIEAVAFSDTVHGAWTRFDLGLLEKEAFRIDGLLPTLAELRNPTRYPSACLLAPILAEANSIAYQFI